MRNGFLTAATVLIVCGASAWSQEPQSSIAPLIQASGELQPNAAEVLPAPITQSAPPPENWTPPPLVGSYLYAGNRSRYWASADLLFLSIKPGQTPPLVTTDTTGGMGGQIGAPGTAVLYGGNQGSNMLPGGRFTMGTWLDQGQTSGVEASYFFLNGPSDNFSASSDGAPGSLVLARPFINAINLDQDRQQISVIGTSGGSALVSSSSFFQGAQLNGICNLCCSCPTNCCSTSCCQTVAYQPGYINQSGYRVDLIGGFQYLNLNENLVITENIVYLPTAPPPFVPGSTIMVTDVFETRNSFYGGQIGARGEWYRGAWFANVSGQVALGDTHQEVRINGTTVFTDPGGPPNPKPGGFLALPTNIGSYSRDKFSTVDQGSINVGRQLTNNVRVYVGYTLIYWSSVVRPGDQIDPFINTTQLPTPTDPQPLVVGERRPAFAFHDTSLWAQGINAGLQFGW